MKPIVFYQAFLWKFAIKINGPAGLRPNLACDIDKKKWLFKNAGIRYRMIVQGFRGPSESKTTQPSTVNTEPVNADDIG
jgi:hypothetical protein